MAVIFSSMLYLLSLLLNLAVLVLVFEWFFFLLPSAGFNEIRRFLFKISHLLLAWSEKFFLVRWRIIQFRGLFMALFLWMINFYGVPWLVLFSYSLRN